MSDVRENLAKQIAGAHIDSDLWSPYDIADWLLTTGLVAPVEYEYGWEADETIRQTLSPRGPRYQFDGHFGTPEEIARFPKGKRIRRRKPGAWEVVTERTDRGTPNG